MEVTFIGVSNSNYGSKSHQLRAQGWKKVRVTVEGRKKMRLKRAEQLMMDYIEKRGLAGVGAMTNVSALEAIMKKVDEEIPLKGMVLLEMYEPSKKSNAMSVNNVVPAGEVFLPETGPHAEAAAAAHANVDLMTNAQLEEYKKQEKAKFQKMFQTLLEKVRVGVERVRIGTASSAESTPPFYWKPSAAAATSSGVGLYNKYGKNLPKLSRSKKNPVKAPQRPKQEMSMGSLFGALKGITSKPSVPTGIATKKVEKRTLKRYNNPVMNAIQAAIRDLPSKPKGGNRTKRNKRTKKNKKH
jgi:hypothetical protein